MKIGESKDGIVAHTNTAGLVGVEAEDGEDPVTAVGKDHLEWMVEILESLGEDRLYLWTVDPHDDGAEGKALVLTGPSDDPDVGVAIAPRRWGDEH